MTLTTTKRLLRKYKACKDRYNHLIAHLGARGDNEKISLTEILQINGLGDTLWALRTVPKKQRFKRDRVARLFACQCIRKTPLADGRTVWDLLTDERSRQGVIVAERYICGSSTDDELAAAWTAAWTASDARAARAAARAAAWTAAWTAAEAAWIAARAAAEAARDATSDAADTSAAWEAAWNAQEKILKEILNVDKT